MRWKRQPVLPHSVVRGVSAVRKIDVENEKVTVIPSVGIPDAPHPILLSFNVDTNGNVYQLAAIHVGRYVLVFDSNGEFKSKIKLDPGFEWTPYSIGVLANGDFLVTGTWLISQLKIRLRNHLLRYLRATEHCAKK